MPNLGVLVILLGLGLLIIILLLFNERNIADIEQTLNTPSEILKTLMWVCNVIFGLLLLAWPIGVFTSIFFFDAPGSAKNPFVLSMAWSIWMYPVTYLIGLIGSILLYKKKNYKAGFLFAVLPVINFLWFFTSMVL